MSEKQKSVLLNECQYSIFVDDESDVIQQIKNEHGGLYGIKRIDYRIQKTGHQPFLFVGSGFSKRYMNTEKWDELLKVFCEEYNGNDFQYNVYSNQIEEKDYYGKQPAIATLLEKDYNNIVLTSDKYKDFREKHKTELKNNSSALKIAVSEHLSHAQFDPENEEITLLRQLGKRSISGVITTNYDVLLENIYPEYAVYVGQEELLFNNISGIGEIYKIHGSITKPDSLVLTSLDYEEFEENASYLIVKLLTIFLEYPIIFMGYSLSDRNIRNIFETIANCLTQKKLDQLKDRFIFVEYSASEQISEFSMQFSNGNNVRMNKIATTDFAKIYKAVGETKSKYNPVILRHLRRDIYEMANSVQTSDKIVAVGFENLDNVSKIRQFILGVGVAKNGHIIKAEQLYEDVVLDNQYFNPDLVVEEYLPELLKNNSGGLPMYKYLCGYSKDVFERVKENVLKHRTVDSFLNKQLRIQKENYRKSVSDLSVKGIIANETNESAYKKLIFLEESEIDVNELKDYLQNYIMKHTPNCLKNNSELKRLIRIYDLVKYK